MGKIIFFLIFTVISIFVALIPEIGMYWVWSSLVHPETDVARIITLAVFLFGGGWICVLFAMFGFLLWVSGIEQL